MCIWMVKPPFTQYIPKVAFDPLRHRPRVGYLLDFYDEDQSGIDSSRPDFNRMIEAAKAKKFQIILCKSQSRFTRDMELVEKYIHGLFPIWGIRFIAVADNADTEVKGNKKARQVNGLVNEWYLEDLSENVRMVFDLKRRRWCSRSTNGRWRAMGGRTSPIC